MCGLGGDISTFNQMKIGIFKPAELRPVCGWSPVTWRPAAPSWRPCPAGTSSRLSPRSWCGWSTELAADNIVLTLFKKRIKSVLWCFSCLFLRKFYGDFGGHFSMQCTRIKHIGQMRIQIDEGSRHLLTQSALVLLAGVFSPADPLLDIMKFVDRSWQETTMKSKSLPFKSTLGTLDNI